MTFKAFIDADTILDVLAKREPFYDSAAQLFSLIEKGSIKGFTSVIVFTNVYYILRKQISFNATRESLNDLRSLLQILPVDSRMIESALGSDFTDFEDAVQYFCAETNGIKYLITRNKMDYRKAGINILSAKEFLSMVQAQSDN